MTSYTEFIGESIKHRVYRFIKKGDEKASGKFGSEAEQRWVPSRLFSLVIILQI